MSNILVKRVITRVKKGILFSCSFFGVSFSFLGWWNEAAEAKTEAGMYQKSKISKEELDNQLVPGNCNT